VVLFILVIILVLIVAGTVLLGLGHAKDKGWFRPKFFFNTGMLGIIISGFLLMMLCLLLYVLSGFFQIACQGVRDLERVDNTTQKTSRAYVLPLYEDIVESCKMGEGAYTTFDLNQIYDINDVLTLKDRFENLPPISARRNTLEKLSFTHLENTLSTVKNAMEEASDGLKDLLLETHSLEEDVDRNTNLDSKRIDNFKFSYENQIKDIRKQISTLETNLAILGNIQMSAKNRQLPPMDEIVDQVDEYSKFVYSTTMNTIGECKPMYDALDATIETFCYKVAFPVAGFWLTLAFLLLLYIPLMITIETLGKLK